MLLVGFSKFLHLSTVCFADDGPVPNFLFDRFGIPRSTGIGLYSLFPTQSTNVNETNGHCLLSI